MKKHDEARRTFLVRAAVGAGAIAGRRADARYARPGSRAGRGSRGLSPPAFERARGMVHFSTATKPPRLRHSPNGSCPARQALRGASDAEVLNYIDLALAGAYADLQDFYRRGLTQLDAYCRKTYNEPFVRLDAARQDEVITALEGGKATGFTWPATQEFFNTVRTHTMEGMFADPIYGGNKDFAGWRLVGFPGTQAVFTPADMQSRQAFTRAPMVGLQAQAKDQ